jgi:hypothetical protein
MFKVQSVRISCLVVLMAVAECQVVDVLRIWLSVEEAVLIRTEVMWSTDLAAQRGIGHTIVGRSSSRFQSQIGHLGITNNHRSFHCRVALDKHEGLKAKNKDDEELVHFDFFAGDCCRL